MTGPAIVWYRDDLRVSDHPALHAASNAHAPVCLHLRARRQGAWPSAARGRGALVAGAVTARPAGEPARAGASLVLRKGPAPKVIAALAREIDAERTGTRSRNRRIGPWPIRSPRRSARSVSPRNAFPAICWPRRTRSATRRTGACACSRRSGGGAGARRSAKAAAGAEAAERRAQPRQR